MFKRTKIQITEPSMEEETWWYDPAEYHKDYYKWSGNDQCRYLMRLRHHGSEPVGQFAICANCVDWHTLKHHTWLSKTIHWIIGKELSRDYSKKGRCNVYTVSGPHAFDDTFCSVGKMRKDYLLKRSEIADFIEGKVNGMCPYRISAFITTMTLEDKQFNQKLGDSFKICIKGD